MRITNNMLTSNYLNNVSNNLKQLQKLQHQGATGKAVSKPSDNPILISKIMSLKNNIVENENYNNTISDSKAWVATQDSALDEGAKSMRRIRDLTISAAKGTLSEVDRKAIQAEVEAEIGTLKDVLNTNFDGRYIFSGQETMTRPFEENSSGELEYKGDTNNLQREISKGVTLELMTNGEKLSKVDGENIGEFLNNLLEDIIDMDDDTVDKLGGEYIRKIDGYLDNLVTVRTQIGAIDNRLEAAKLRNETENIALKESLSQKEDVDLVENYMESILMSTIYQASLSVGAKILEPSLLDYIR